MDWISPVVPISFERIPTDAAEMSQVGLVDCFVSLLFHYHGIFSEILGEALMAVESGLASTTSLVQGCWRLL